MVSRRDTDVPPIHTPAFFFSFLQRVEESWNKSRKFAHCVMDLGRLEQNLMPSGWALDRT